MLGEDTGAKARENRSGGIRDEREAGRAGGVSSERAGSGRNRGKLCKNASYFVIEKGFKKARMAN